MIKPFGPFVSTLAVIVLAAFPAGPTARDSIRAAQAELTRAEATLNDARAAERKAKSAADKTRARAAVAAAEQTATEAAVALARARSGIAHGAAPVNTPPDAASEALINARIDVEAAEKIFAQAVDARAKAEQVAAETIRAFAHDLATVADRRQSAAAMNPESQRQHLLAEIDAMENRIKSGVQAATAPAIAAQAREREARVALEAARTREDKARAVIGARFSAEH